MEKIKNVNGKPQCNCHCINWLEHWEKYSARIAVFCSISDCYNHEGLIGAHVQKLDSDDEEHYIIPMCKAHHTNRREQNTKWITRYVAVDNVKTYEKT